MSARAKAAAMQEPTQVCIVHGASVATTFSARSTLNVVLLAPKSTTAMVRSMPPSGIWCVISLQAFSSAKASTSTIFAASPAAATAACIGGAAVRRKRGRRRRTSKHVRFGLMIAASTVVMFGLMYLDTCEASHAYFSETRAYMAWVMGAAMALVMLGFRWSMCDNRRADVSWMKAMIPHHSIAILTSERATIRDPRVRKLADGIIETQRKEIAEMQALIRNLDR